MDTRREFIKKAAMLAGGTGLAGMLPEAIQKALAIDPALGSTWMDAEHVVILMQENRSFDHCYGSLQGVRGFNDPRAVSLPNKNLVWMQTNAAGETYTPFRLNIKDTKATHMGSLPHSWTDQVDALNNGRHDQWLTAKKPGNKEYAAMPLTLGYYNREDLPFYYSLADAFTVCDQHFCSSLTGTTPNRLYLWTGTIRDQQNGTTYANVRNEDVDYSAEAHWTTFPERLEDAQVSWKIYQNELSVGVGFTDDEDSWLANFTDNPIEWFEQYQVRFLPAYMKYLPKKIEGITAEIKTLEAKLPVLPANGEEAVKANQRIVSLKKALEVSLEEQKKYTPENYAKLTQREKNLHTKAFTTNVNDPFYHELTTLKYEDGSTSREMKVPKGDVLHQFRQDVQQGTLPTVSWLVAPGSFSDHPGSPWYGAWYVSEAMDILTQNPEVWKKTIFILTYDENDGYFDHVPPFTPPQPGKPETGLTSTGIDTSVEWLTMQQERNKRPNSNRVRESAIGLGYRVPMVVASPWSRGGAVCSQVFDHTSVLQFLEKLISHKTGKPIKESNISTWRRTVCGDLTSLFKPYQGEKIALPSFLPKDDFIESVHKAQFKGNPSGYRVLSVEEIAEVNRNPAVAAVLPKQEAGIRPSCALPYQLSVEGKLSADKKSFSIQFAAGKDAFGAKLAGAPFMVYSVGASTKDTPIPRSYAVAAGDAISDTWYVETFERNLYHLRVHGPNGFYREFMGNSDNPLIDITCVYQRNSKKQLTGNIGFKMVNNSKQPYTVEMVDNAYKGKAQTRVIAAGATALLEMDLSRNFNWYDISIKVKGAGLFENRYAGRVETGKAGFSDPLMGRAVR
jgi:phospholipase C